MTSGELRQSLQQQTATAEVLRIISNSPGELMPVFEAILANTTRLCEAKFGTLWMCEGDGFRCAAIHNWPPAHAEWLQRQPAIYHPGPANAIGRVLASRQIVHIADVMAERAYADRDPLRVATVEILGARTLVVIPMVRDKELIGAITIFRQEVRPFTDEQIELVKTSPPR